LRCLQLVAAREIQRWLFSGYDDYSTATWRVKQFFVISGKMETELLWEGEISVSLSDAITPVPIKICVNPSRDKMAWFKTG
jgi:hypothetical protein